MSWELLFFKYVPKINMVACGVSISDRELFPLTNFNDTKSQPSSVSIQKFVTCTRNIVNTGVTFPSNDLSQSFLIRLLHILIWTFSWIFRSFNVFEIFYIFEVNNRILFAFHLFKCEWKNIFISNLKYVLFILPIQY